MPKAYDADLIEAGTERAIESLDPMTLNFRTPDGVPEDFAAGRVKAAIEKDGYWVTLPDESGVALYYGGEAVLDRAGNPVTRKFDDLAAEAVTPRFTPKNDPVMPEGRMLDYSKTRSVR